MLYHADEYVVKDIWHLISLYLHTHMHAATYRIIISKQCQRRTETKVYHVHTFLYFIVYSLVKKGN